MPVACLPLCGSYSHRRHLRPALRAPPADVAGEVVAAVARRMDGPAAVTARRTDDARREGNPTDDHDGPERDRDKQPVTAGRPDVWMPRKRGRVCLALLRQFAIGHSAQVMSRAVRPTPVLVRKPDGPIHNTNDQTRWVRGPEVALTRRVHPGRQDSGGQTHPRPERHPWEASTHRCTPTKIARRRMIGPSSLPRRTLGTARWRCQSDCSRRQGRWARQLPSASCH